MGNDRSLSKSSATRHHQGRLPLHWILYKGIRKAIWSHANAWEDVKEEGSTRKSSHTKEDTTEAPTEKEEAEMKMAALEGQNGSKH